MKISFLLFLLMIGANFFSLAHAVEHNSSPQDIKWQVWSPTVFEQAKNERRLIMVYAKAPWCHWCQKMENTTFKDPAIIKMINTHYMPILIDIEKNIALATQFKIADLPTMIILDTNHEIIKKFSGYYSPNIIIKKLEEVINTQSFTAMHITIVGSKNDLLAKQLYMTALSYKNNSTIIEWLAVGEQAKDYPEIKFPILKTAAAYVCINHHCSFPILTPNQFSGIIQQLSTTPNAINQKNVDNLSVTNIGNLSLDQNKAKKLLIHHNLFSILTGFWLLGFLLAFTPCVLPLILIIAGFLCGKTGQISKNKTISLSCTYVISLSITYAIAGMIAAVCGIYIQAYLQNTWTVGAFSLLFVILALSLLGLYKLQLPLSWRVHFIKYNKFRKHYTHTQVAIMGVLATLIASPCMAAPLAGVLSYIGSQGSLLLGGIALFSVGLGIGTPLILASCLGVKMLPELHSWQEGIKEFFGLLLMGIAIWLLERIIPGSWSMILWSILAIFTAIYIGILKEIELNNSGILRKTISIIVLIYGIALFVGMLLGNTNPLQPLNFNQIMQKNSSVQTASFLNIKNLQEFQSELDLAKTKEMPILLDFYAGWCDSCHRMDDTVYKSEIVQPFLKKFILLRVNLTIMQPALQELIKHFDLVSPPAALFFNGQGKEINLRIFDNIDASKFADVLNKILNKEIK